MKELYKKDSKNKLRIWKIYTKGAELIQEAGLLNGKLVKNSKICIGKNLGKSNETSPENQAILELESTWKSKKDEGYFETLNEVETIEVILPMLAKSYSDEKSKIDWRKNVYIQPKLDGMRCLAHIKNGEVRLISRDGKLITTVNHINDDLSKIEENIILDGELYAHGLSFQENMKLIKKYRAGETKLIKFHVYDLINESPFSLRKVRQYVKQCSNLVEVSTYPAKDEKEMKYWHSKFINEGYEGSIIRHGEEGYKINGRSSNLLKYKDFIDIAIKIKDIEPAPQRPEWGVPVFEWKGAENDELRAGMKFSHEERKEWLLNKNDYIGKTAEVRFFEYSDEGVPRFPVCVGIRLDK
jgi:DNA ligase-1